MITPPMAQLGLRYGADDIDGTIMNYEITHVIDAQGMEELVHTMTDIASDVKRVTSSLSEVLGGDAGTASLQAIGTAWLTSRRSAALVVPSAIITIERNTLLNPLHPELRRVRITEDAPFSFDTRLL